MSLNRRALVASSLAVPALALLNKSTFASAPQPTGAKSANSRLPAEYQQAADDLAAVGRRAVEAVLNRDDQALVSMMSNSGLEWMAEKTATQIIESVEGGRVTFAVPDFDALVDTNFDGSQQMTGFYNQGTISTLELATDEAQQDDRPTGTWWGTLAGFLEVSINFGDTSLSVPSAGTWVTLDDVEVESNRPVGELLTERSLPVGGGNSQYGAKYSWSDVADLTIIVVIADDGFVDQVVAWPEFHLPEDPAAGIEAEISYQLPVEDDWLVLWGGDTEFVNYHATAPIQRHAYDLMAWEDGATFTGNGTSNDQYFAFGRPVLAPADGTVVSAANWMEDMQPGVILDASGMELAGNHVVLQTADNEFVLLAHMQSGSVLVNVGDVVSVGQQLGAVGNSGRSSQAHLHIHVHTAADPIDLSSICLRLPFANVIADGKKVGKTELLQGQIIRPA